MNRYKAHAAECFRLAQTAASREQKAILIGLAREWEVMAQQMDESTGQQPNDGAVENPLDPNGHANAARRSASHDSA